MSDQSILGKTCDWCGEPAVDSVEIEPVQYRAVTHVDPVTGYRTTAHEVSRFAIHADVCSAHKDVRDCKGGTPIQDKRRRKDEGVEQLDILGTAKGPGNAIFKDVA